MTVVVVAAAAAVVVDSPLVTVVAQSEITVGDLGTLNFDVTD